MTTDTVAKTAYRTITLGGKEVQFAGMAKGAGMIMPNMATMLAFVITDAQISFTELHPRCWKVSRGPSTGSQSMAIPAPTIWSWSWPTAGPAIPGLTKMLTADRQLFQDALEGLLKELALEDRQ